MASADESVLTKDGLRLFVRIGGHGERCVIIPNGLVLADDLAPLPAGRRLVFYDLRNRGLSDAVSDPLLLAGGIHNDVDDLEAVRRWLNADTVDLIGHSYVGLTVILHAMKYGAHVRRVVAIGAMGPHADKAYPAHLQNVDGVAREVFDAIAVLRGRKSSFEPEAYCRAVWSILSRLYVTNPDDAARIRWGRCDLANERNFMRYWMESLLPSIQALRLDAADLASVAAPVLCIHGRDDRSAPYGGALDWQRLLPNARLLTVDGAGHAPWIEQPELVLGAIAAFLEGAWPPSAERQPSRVVPSRP